MRGNWPMFGIDDFGAHLYYKLLLRDKRNSYNIN